MNALEERQLLLPGGTWADLAARLRGAVLDELAARVRLPSGFIQRAAETEASCASDGGPELRRRHGLPFASLHCCMLPAQIMRWAALPANSAAGLHGGMLAGCQWRQIFTLARANCCARH